MVSWPRIAFDELKENGQTAEAIYQAFSALPEPQQAKIEAECQEIKSMAHQTEVTVLIDEATDFHKNVEFPEAINQQGQGNVGLLGISKLLGRCHLEPVRGEHPRCLVEQTQRLPHVAPHVKPEDTERLADTLSPLVTS